MLKRFIVSFLLASLIGWTPAYAANAVGVTTLTVNSPEREQALAVTLWYPAASGGSWTQIGKSAIFESAQGYSDAPAQAGSFPLVLVSHGGMRSAPHLGEWIGSALAARGFVAAVVSHPRLRPDDADIALQEVWKRPADLSATVTHLENDPSWNPTVNFDKVGALGFFVGGTAVLSLSGAQFDYDRFTQLCADDSVGIDCRWFAEQGVRMSDVDRSMLTRSNEDPRIRSAVAVDPEMSTAFSADSLSTLDAEITILNLGSTDTLIPGLYAGHLAEAIPRAEYAQIEDATQFSAFSVCKAKGAAILAEEGDSDALCTSDSATGRSRIHEAIAGKVADVFERL